MSPNVGDSSRQTRRSRRSRESFRPSRSLKADTAAVPADAADSPGHPPLQKSQPATTPAAASKPTKSTTTTAGAKKTAGPWPQIEVQVSSTGSTRVAKASTFLPAMLTQQVAKVQGMFAAMRPEWGARSGFTPPTGRAIYEALAWLGIEYVNDPDLARLIPPDGRYHRTDVVLAIPDGDPIASPQGAQQISGIDWQAGMDDSRARCTLRLTHDLSMTIDNTAAAWRLAHPDWVEAYAAPGASAFREGLLRLGLKHVNDPKLADVMPLDGRRAD